MIIQVKKNTCLTQETSSKLSPCC